MIEKCLQNKARRVQKGTILMLDPAHSPSSFLIRSFSTWVPLVYWPVRTPVMQYMYCISISVVVSSHTSTRCTLHTAGQRGTLAQGQRDIISSGGRAGHPHPGDVRGCGCAAFILTFGEQVDDTMVDGDSD